MSKANENKGRQLLIMRHGKANWEIEVDDLQRPMTARGEEEAKHIGRWLYNHSYKPDIIFSSTAARALATSNFVIEKMGETSIEQDSRIYNAGVAQLLEVLASLPTEVKRPMIVGHNPGFEDLLLHLAEVDAKFYKDGSLFTTGTVAILNMPDDWRKLDRHCGELVNVVRGGVL